MANLKTFSGFPIQNLSSDPVPFAQAKTNDPYVGSWASGTNVNTARRSMASAGTQTASIITGGLLPPGTYAITEQWNGSAWTEVADLNTGRWYFKGSGTSTAALAYGGVESTPTASAKTELWNGSGWTETGDLNTARQKMGNSTTGTTTASIAFGGSPADPAGGGALSINESWNGSAWTEVADLNTARKGLGGSGTSTAALAIAGNTGSVSALNESWNGSSWTEVGDLNTAREQGGTAGTQTSAITWSGYPDSPGVLTEQWNGSAWTEVSDLANKQIASGSAGVSGESAAAISGYNGSSNVATVEDWSFSGIPPTAPAAGYSDAIVGQMYYNSTSGQFKAINAGVGSWASGGNLNNSRNSGNITGNASSAMNAGGEVSPSAASNYVENYNGTSWTEVTEMGTARGRPALTNTNGNSDVLLISGGASPLGSTNAINNVEKWDGSSWTEIAEVNTARLGGQAFGITTASIFSGGYTPGDSIVTNTEYWNGSSWTELNDMSTLRVNFANWGVYNSGGMAGGSSPTRALHETWDGTSWTETTDMNTGRSSLGGGGASSSSGMVFGGTTTPGTQSDDTEIWDGSSWTEVGDLGQTDGEATGSSPTVGSSIAKLDNPSKNQTEEWSLPDFTINPVTTS